MSWNILFNKLNIDYSIDELKHYDAVYFDTYHESPLIQTIPFVVENIIKFLFTNFRLKNKYNRVNQVFYRYVSLLPFSFVIGGTNHIYLF